MSNQFSTQLKIYFACSNISSPGVFEKKNTYVKLFAKVHGQKPLLGQTEVVEGTLSPVYRNCIELTYFYLMEQDMRAEIWSSGKKFLGYAEFSMSTLLQKRSLDMTVDKECKMYVGMTLCTHQKTQFLLSIRARSLPTPTFGSISPVLKISRLLGHNHANCVYTSEKVSKTANPQWKTITSLRIADLCGDDFVTPVILFEVFDDDKLLGAVTVSGTQLCNSTNVEYALAMPDAPEKVIGYLCIDKSTFYELYDFIDYLRAGMQVNIAFGIDFTESNGFQNDPSSLHHFDPNVPNEYISAMLSVSEAVQHYDSDRLYPVYGFGATAPFTQGKSDFFCLTGNPQNAFVTGMQSVIDLYATALPHLQFGSPMNFAPMIRNVTEGARSVRGVYTILLLLTDGAITDVEATADAIVAADDAPLSIVILGVGKGDFSAMRYFDANQKPLVDTKGNTCRRDLVSFVEFESLKTNPRALNTAIIEDIPWQVELWGRLTGTSPSRFSASQ